MTKIRRWYMFLVSGISLQAVTWAIIALLRNLFITSLNTPRTQIAFEIAVVIIGLPFFLGHWMWAQRLAREDDEERTSGLRQYYLYAIMAGFLIPFVENTAGLLTALLGRIFDINNISSITFEPVQPVSYNIIAMLILGLFWYYHFRITKIPDVSGIANTSHAEARRLYIYGFTAAGLVMTLNAGYQLLRWLLYQFGDSPTSYIPNQARLAIEIPNLIVGASLWVVFWTWAQRLFRESSPGERASALRKLFLYIAVFAGLILTLINATVILAGLFRNMFGLSSMGDARDTISFVTISVILWAYYAYILRADADKEIKRPRQVAIRRLYLYLVAGAGLAALLIGLGGDISVLIRSLAGESFTSDFREEQLSWFTAALIVGLPTWIIPWRALQLTAVIEDAVGDEERRSIIRKIYLYFYLFVASMTLLSSGIYIVSQLIELILDARSSANLLSDLGQTIAFALIAAGVGLYHRAILGQDGRFTRQAEDQRLEQLDIAILSMGANGIETAIYDGLKREIPQARLHTIDLAGVRSEIDTTLPPMEELISHSQVLIGFWDVTTEKAVGQDVATAVANSPAHKLLIPAHDEHLDWIGLKQESPEKIVKETIHAVKQIAAGEEVTPTSSLGIGSIIGIIIGGLILFSLIISLISFLIEQVF